MNDAKSYITPTIVAKELLRLMERKEIQAKRDAVITFETKNLQASLDDFSDGILIPGMSDPNEIRDLGFATVKNDTGTVEVSFFEIGNQIRCQIKCK